MKLATPGCARPFPGLKWILYWATARSLFSGEEIQLAVEELPPMAGLEPVVRKSSPVTDAAAFTRVAWRSGLARRAWGSASRLGTVAGFVTLGTGTAGASGRRWGGCRRHAGERFSRLRTTASSVGLALADGSLQVSRSRPWATATRAQHACAKHVQAHQQPPHRDLRSMLGLRLRAARPRRIANAYLNLGLLRRELQLHPTLGLLGSAALVCLARRRSQRLARIHRTTPTVVAERLRCAGGSRAARVAPDDDGDHQPRSRLGAATPRATTDTGRASDLCTPLRSERATQHYAQKQRTEQAKVDED